MKKLGYLLALSVILMQACKEKEIAIPELSVGNRRVLVEEVTGVNCSNCPDGARELAALQASYGSDKLILMAIHAGGTTFSTPLAQSQYDLQTTEGYQMVDYVGQLFGVPSAAVNRSVRSNDPDVWLVAGWASRIADEFKKDYGLGVFVTNTYDEATRKLDIKVNLAPDQTLTGNYHLTVAITEDSIIDAQNDNLVIKPSYVHRHVLRDLVSRIDGDPIDEAITKGALISKTYSVTMPANWEAKHCAVVAYVHRDGNPDKEVMQVAEAHVIE